MMWQVGPILSRRFSLTWSPIAGPDQIMRIMTLFLKSRSASNHPNLYVNFFLIIIDIIRKIRAKGEKKISHLR